MTYSALIFSPYVISSSIPPLAPALLKSCLAKDGVESTVLDFNIDFHHWITLDEQHQQLSVWMNTPHYQLDSSVFSKFQVFIESCLQKIKRLDCRVIGISAFSHVSQPFVEDLCYALKLKLPHIHIVLGGSGCSISHQQYSKTWGEIMFENNLVDCVVYGEAEHIIADIFKNKTTGIVSVPQISNDELLEIPIPDFADYQWDLYGPIESIQLPITSTKGCVRKCSFCDVAHLWPKFRYRQGAKVADEIIQIYQKYGIVNFSFTDSLINGGLKPFREMNEQLSIRLPNTIHYVGQFICRDQHSMPPNDFALMARGGCTRVSIGIESGSQAVRDHMKKGFSDEDLHYTAEQLLRNGISQSWNIIVGYPTETDDDWHLTIDLIKRYKKYHQSIKIYPVGVFQLLGNTPITTDDALEHLAIENLSANGYKEYNWVSANNPKNTLRHRANQWQQLVALIKDQDMVGISAARLDEKTHVLLKQLEYYESKSNRPIFKIHQQSFQEPANFID